MRKTKIALIAALVITLVLPFQAFAEKNLEPVTTLKFEDVEKLMMARCRMILDNMEAYSDKADGQDKKADQLDSYLNQWAGVKGAFDKQKTGGANAYLEDTLTYLLNAQHASLLSQRSSIAATNLTDVGLQTEQGNYTIVWNMEKLFIKYNTLSHQLEDMLAKKPLLEKQLEAAKLQKELGMATETAVISAESQLSELESGIQQLEEAREAIKQTFNVNLAQEYDTDLKICGVPSVTREMIEAINVDEDYKEAIKKSYDVRLKDDDKDKENDARRQFKNSFYRAYQTILDKQKALEAAKLKMAVEENNLKTAEIKFELGMISALQYEAEKSSYASQKAALEEAEDALFQAYREYQWAKRGLIVSTDSSASGTSSSGASSSGMPSK